MPRSMSTSSDDSSIVFEMNSGAGSRATSRAVSRSPSIVRPPLLPLSSTVPKATPAQSTLPLTNATATSATNTEKKVTNVTQKDATTLPNAVMSELPMGKAVVTSATAAATCVTTAASIAPTASVVPAAGVERSLSSVSSDSSSPSFHFSPSPRHELDADALNKEVSDIKAENGVFTSTSQEIRVNESQHQGNTIGSQKDGGNKSASLEDTSLNFTSAPAAPPAAALTSDGLNSSMSENDGQRDDHDGDEDEEVSRGDKSFIVYDEEREPSDKVVNELDTASPATLEEVLIDPTLNQRLLPNQRKAMALAHARRILQSKMAKFRKSVVTDGVTSSRGLNDDGNDDDDGHSNGGGIKMAPIGGCYMGAVLSSMKWEDGVLDAGEKGSPPSNFGRSLEYHENAEGLGSELKDTSPPPLLLGARRVNSIHSSIDSGDVPPHRPPISSQMDLPSDLVPTDSQALNPNNGRAKSFPKTKRLIPYEEPSKPSEHFSYARALSAERRQRNTEMTHEEAYGSELIPTHHKLVFEEDDSHLPMHPVAVTKQREIRAFEEIFSSNIHGSDPNNVSAEGKDGSHEDVKNGRVLVNAGKIEKIRRLLEHDLNPTDEVLFLPEENLIIQPRMKFTGFKAIGDLYEDSYLPKWSATRDKELREREQRRRKMDSEGRTVARAALIARLSKPLAKDRIVFEERAPSPSSTASDGDEHTDEASEKRDTGLNDDLVGSSPRVRKAKRAPKPPQRIVGDDGTIRIILSREDMAKRYPEKGAGANAKSKGVGGNVPSGCQLPFFDSHAYYLRISVPAGIFNLKQALHLRGARSTPTKEASHQPSAVSGTAHHATETTTSQKKAYPHAAPRREVRFTADSVLKEASGFFEHEMRAEAETSLDRDMLTDGSRAEDNGNTDKEDYLNGSSFILVAIDRYTPLLSIIERFGPAYFPPGGQLALAKTGELLAGSSFPAPLGLVTPSDVSTGSSTHKATDQPSSPFGSSTSPQQTTGNFSACGSGAVAAGNGLGDVLSYKCGTGTAITVGMLERDPRLNDLCYVTSVELDEVMERKRIMTGRLVERNMLVAGLTTLLEHELRDEYKKMRRGLPTFVNADYLIEQAANDRVKAIETLIRKEHKASAKEKRQKKDLYRDVRLTKYDFRKVRKRKQGGGGGGSFSESPSSRASSCSSSSSSSTESHEEKLTKRVGLAANINDQNNSADCGPLLELQSLLASMKLTALSLDNCLPFTDGSAAARNPFAGTKSDSCTKGYEKIVQRSSKKSRRSDKRREKAKGAGVEERTAGSEYSGPQKDEAPYNTNYGGEVDKEEECKNLSSAYTSRIIQDDPLRYVAFFGGDASYYALGSEPSKTEALQRLEALRDQERARRAAKKELNRALREGERRPQSPSHTYHLGIVHVNDCGNTHGHYDDSPTGANDQNGANNGLERAIERILHPGKGEV